MQAKRDDNRISDGLSWDGTTPRRLLVDPSTSRLEIVISASLGNSPVVHSQPTERDENKVTVSMTVTDNTQSLPIPLHVDAVSGFLAVDLILA